MHHIYYIGNIDVLCIIYNNLSQIRILFYITQINYEDSKLNHLHENPTDPTLPQSSKIDNLHKILNNLKHTT